MISVTSLCRPLATRLFVLLACLVAIFSIASWQRSAHAQQGAQRARFDVTNYRIDAELRPSDRTLRAVSDVTFTPLEATRSVTFELNGSLKLEAVERIAGGITSSVASPAVASPRTSTRGQQARGQASTSSNATSFQRGAVTFVQDAVGVGDIGPSVRVDLGDTVAANQPVTLRFRYAGALVSPEGGPLATKRLAAVSNDVSYLMYAARWFPFHEYAADRATAEINITAPAGYQVVGSSDLPAVVQSSGATTQYRFVTRQPALIGNIAAGRYQTRQLRIGNVDLQFYVLPGYENRIETFAELAGRAHAFYTKQYGAPASGNRMIIAQIDNDSLDAVSAPGMEFLSTRFFEQSRELTTARLPREVAFQWWGQTVGLKSFDDAWLSQGFAEWSSYNFRETFLTPAQLESAQREMLENALVFLQTASIARAPQTLDDQSTAYQTIMYSKGAMVFRMLRETLGKEQFDRLLRTYFDQFKNRQAAIQDFENLSTQVAGENMRYFFARWIEGTAAPEFSADYQIIRTREGKFRTRGTVRQNLENLRMPVDLLLRTEGENKPTTIRIEDKSEDFDFESNQPPIEVIVDPNNEIIRMSEELKIAVAARRGIELYREGQLTEAQRQLEEALKLDRSNSWIYYNLGMIYLDQQNYDFAIDNFQAALDGNLRPDWIEAWARIKRGNAYDAKGDRTRANFEYQQAVKSGINYDNAQSTARAYLAKPYDPRNPQQ